MRDFEDDLRQALRPIDPGDQFAERVLQRLPTQQRSGRLRQPIWRWVPAALAASLVVAVLTVQQYRQYREQQAGDAARQQVMQALRMTSEKLDVAYRIVQNQARSQPPAAENSDAST
jgi:hypothetical protein